MNSDWRLTNQMNYLYQKELIKTPFKPYREGWEHEHCEFCSERIDETTTIAYATKNRYHWICQECYEDFKDMFEWSEEKMKTIIVDFTECRSYLQLHLLLKETFQFPEHYGKNLDALWDCLRDFCYSPARILIKGAKTCPEEMKEYMEKILDVFDDLHEEDEDIIIQVLS